MQTTNLTEVSKDAFFKALYADKRDIMPVIVGKWSQELGYRQEWRVQHYRTLFGVTYGHDYAPKGNQYFLVG